MILQSAVDRLLQTTHPVLRETAEQIHGANHELKNAMREYRQQVIEHTAQGQIKTTEVLRRMDTARTLRRLGYHLWRIADHLAEPEAERSVTGPETN